MRPVFCLVFSAVLAGACGPSPDTCLELRSRLDACGLPSGGVSCAAADTAAERYLLSRLDADGCTALSTGQEPSVCKAAGWPCPPPPGPAPLGTPPKYPLVFVSGIDNGVAFDWNPRILRAIADLGGASPEHVRLSPWSTPDTRARDLWNALLAIPAPRVNLVCYAVAGLDCRFLVSEGGLFANEPRTREAAVAHVASITTIATPHRGTRVADAALLAIGAGGLATAEDLLHAVLKDAPGQAPPDEAGLSRTLRGLTVEALPNWNLRVVDAHGIHYQSFAGVSAVRARTSNPSEDAIYAHCGRSAESPFLGEPPARDALALALWATVPFAAATLDDHGNSVTSPSDGMVSVESAKWGEFRGCLPADHYDVIGQLGHVTRDPLTGFDAPRFYSWLATDLAARGF